MFVHRDEKMYRKINILSQLRFNFQKVIAKYSMGFFYFDSKSKNTKANGKLSRHPFHLRDLKAKLYYISLLRENGA